MVDTFLDETRRRQAERQRLREAGHAAADSLQRLAPMPPGVDPTTPTKPKGRDWGFLGEVLGVGKTIGSGIGTALDVGNKYVTRPVLGAAVQAFDGHDNSGESFTESWNSSMEDHPWLKLGAEMVFDPLNLAGIGLVTKAKAIPKVAQLAERSGAFAKIIDNAEVFDDYLDRIQALPITIPLGVARKGINKAFPNAFKQSDRAILRGEEGILRESAKQRGDNLLDFEGETARQSDERISAYLNNDTISMGAKLTTLAGMTPAKLGRAYTNMAPGPLRDQAASLLSDEGLFAVDDVGNIRINPDGTAVKTKKLQAYEIVDSVVDIKQLGEDERSLYSGILDIVAVALYSSNPRRFPQLDDAYETAGKLIVYYSSDKAAVTPGLQGQFRGAFNPQSGQVGLSPISDITTLVHELLGHAFAENMSPDDLARMRAYFGNLNDATASERFAEAIENFMRTGDLTRLPTEVADVVSRYRQHASRINRQGIQPGQFASGARGAGARQVVEDRISGVSSQPQAPNPQFVTSSGGAAVRGQASRLTQAPPVPAPGQQALPGFVPQRPNPINQLTPLLTRTSQPLTPTPAAVRRQQMKAGQQQLPLPRIPGGRWTPRTFVNNIGNTPKSARVAGQQAARTIPFNPNGAPTTPMLGSSTKIDPRTLGRQAAATLPQPPASALPTNVSTINVPGQAAPTVPTPTPSVPQVDAGDARNKLLNYTQMDQATVDALTPQQTLDELKKLQAQWTDELQTAANEVKNLRRQSQMFEAGTANRTRFDPMIAQVRDRYNVLNAQLRDLTPAIDDLEARLASPSTPITPITPIARQADQLLDTTPTAQAVPEPTPQTPTPTQPSLLGSTTTPSGVPVQPGALPNPTGDTRDFLPLVSSYIRNAEDTLARQEDELTRLREMEETAIDPAQLQDVQDQLDRVRTELQDARDLAETNEGAQQMVSELQQRLDAATAQIEEQLARKQGEGLGPGLGQGGGPGSGGTGYFSRERVYERTQRRLAGGTFETIVPGATPDGHEELAAIKQRFDEYVGGGPVEIDEDVYDLIVNEAFGEGHKPKSRGGLKKDGTPKKPKKSNANTKSRRITVADLRNNLLGQVIGNDEIVRALARMNQEGLVSGLNANGEVTLAKIKATLDTPNGPREIEFQSAPGQAPSFGSKPGIIMQSDGAVQAASLHGIIAPKDAVLATPSGDMLPGIPSSGTHVKWEPNSLPNGMYLLSHSPTDTLVEFKVDGGAIKSSQQWDFNSMVWKSLDNNQPIPAAAPTPPTQAVVNKNGPDFDNNFDLKDSSLVKRMLATTPFNPAVDVLVPSPGPNLTRPGKIHTDLDTLNRWAASSPHVVTDSGFNKIAADEFFNRNGGQMNRAARHYTSANYEQMNAAARGERIPINQERRTAHLTDDDWKTLTRELDEYIRQRPTLATPITTFRGVRVDDRIREALDALEQLGPGTTFVEDGFTSVSTDFTTARHFAGYNNRAYFRVNIPENMKFAPGFPDEFELILPRGALYEVRGINRAPTNGGDMWIVDLDYKGSAATGEFPGSDIAGVNMTLGNTESQFRDAIFQSQNSPLHNIFSTTDFGNRGGAQEVINTGRLPQSVDTPTTETPSPLRRDASTGESLNDVANMAGITPGSTGETFVKDMLTEHITENPQQFQALELSSPRAAGMLADAMRAAEAGNTEEAQQLVANAMRRINQQQLSFGMLMPRTKKILDTLLPDNKRLLKERGTRAFGRHDQGTTLADRELEILGKAKTIPTLVKAQKKYSEMVPLVEQTLNDIANAGNPVRPFSQSETTVAEVIEAAKYANADQQKVIDSYLKVFNGKGVTEQMTLREAFAETVVTKYHREMARRMGIPFDKPPTGLSKAWINLTKGWREQALLSIRYHTVNAADLLVRSAIYGVNPTKGWKEAGERARRWGIEIPHDIEIRGYEAEGLRDGLSYDESQGPALGKLPGVGKPLGKLVRWNRELSKEMENAARKAGWAKTVEDHLQQQIMPRMDEEISRVMGTSQNADAFKEMLKLSEGNMSAQQVFDGVIAKGGTADQANELSTLWARGLSEASDRGREFSNAVYFNYTSDVRNIEESLKAFQFLPFHFWATRNIPFYLDTLAANPEFARLWQTYDQISDENREGSGLSGRVEGMLPVDIPLPDLLFGPGTGYFNPLVALSIADQTKPRFTPDDATGVGKLLNEAGRVGLGPAPWVVIPLTVAGVYGDRAEAPDLLRHSRLTEAVLDRTGLEELKVSPLKSAVRGAQEFVTGKEQFTFTGSTYKDRAVATRLAEKSVEETGQANHPAYVAAAADPTSELFKQALADVNRSQLGRELYGFTSPVPMTTVSETEQAIRGDRRALEQQHGGEIPRDVWQQLADQGVLGTGYSRFGGDARGRQVFAGFSALDGIPRTRSALQEARTNQAFPFYAQYLMWLQSQPTGADTSVDAFLKAT